MLDDSNNDNMLSLIDEMAAKWPSSVVARTEIQKFTGGVYSPKTIANLDSLGRGIEDRFYIGKSIVYPVPSLVAWLKARLDAPIKRPRKVY